jgi:hypothetical protein
VRARFCDAQPSQTKSCIRRSGQETAALRFEMAFAGHNTSRAPKTPSEVNRLSLHARNVTNESRAVLTIHDAPRQHELSAKVASYSAQPTVIWHPQLPYPDSLPSQ